MKRVRKWWDKVSSLPPILKGVALVIITLGADEWRRRKARPNNK